MLGTATARYLAREHRSTKTYEHHSTMKRSLIALSLFAASSALSAQVAFNPQIGPNFSLLSNTPNGVRAKSAVGFQVGADLRFGSRLYFQPGAFFGRNTTVITITQPDGTGASVRREDNLVRTTAKVKALLGYNIIDGDAFRLRANVGPTYDVLLSVDNKDDKIKFDKKDFSSGSFNMDAGIGVDIAFITLETGVSYGLSNAYKDAGALKNDSKYFTYYLTAGIVIGGGH